MGKRSKIEVQGITVSINKKDYVSLTDIAKSRDSDTPAFIVRNWLKNQNTLLFLETWESVHNPDFNLEESQNFRLQSGNGGSAPTPQRYIKLTNSIGIQSSAGRYNSGTFAHSDIALHFCFWFDATFQVYFMKEFQRLKREEYERLDSSRTWHISKITDYVDNARILLDSIPGQLAENVRVDSEEE